MPLILRATKGSDLTPAEADGDLTYLDGRITALEALPIGVSISNVTLSGYTLTITMSDASVYTVTFPTPNLSTQFAGAWLPSTAYTAGQIISAYPPMGLYLVNQDHTSDLTFDASVNNSAGDIYTLMLTIPAIATYFNNATTFSPGLLYANSYIRFTNAGGCTITIPQDSDVNFPINTELHFRQSAGAGLTFVAGGSATINPVSGFLDATDKEGAVVTFKKIAANEWDKFGLLSAV